MVPPAAPARLQGWQRVRGAFAVYKTIKRARERPASRILDVLKQRLMEGQHRAAAVAMVLSAVAGSDSTRRCVERALGKWRGSTVSGYLRGDDHTCHSTFRCSLTRAVRSLIYLVGLLMGTALVAAESRTTTHARKARQTLRARQHTDPLTLRYKGRSMPLCHR